MTVYPVIIFCYKRLDCVSSAIARLRTNFLAASTDVYVYSDGPATSSEAEDVKNVRSFLKSVKGFKSLTVIESVENKGLAASVIHGVSEILTDNEAVIVLEDDLLASANFLNFMNEALSFYRDNSKVFSVSGYTFPLRLPAGYASDVYFTQRASSWGWATWRDRWEKIDWDVADYRSFTKNSAAVKQFNRMGSDMSGMLARQMRGEINSWAIRWCYQQFRSGTYSVFPVKSKIQNIGFGEAATHTQAIQNARFATELDRSGKTKFRFTEEVGLEPSLIKQFRAKYNILTRLKYKILGFLSK